MQHMPHSLPWHHSICHERLSCKYEYILYIFRFHGSNPLILTMLVLQSTDLGPEITSHDTYTHTHLTMHRILYVVLTACTMWSHCSLIQIPWQTLNTQTLKHEDTRPYTTLTLSSRHREYTKHSPRTNTSIHKHTHTTKNTNLLLNQLVCCCFSISKTHCRKIMFFINISVRICFFNHSAHPAIRIKSTL